MLRGEGWRDVAEGDSLASRAFRRLTGGTSPRAPPGHPYFTDDETVILQVVEGEHEHGHWHKPLHPIGGWDVVGVGLACIGLMIAAAGGIGGGGILVPLYILVLGFDPKHAIPLSNITIFGGAITNTVLNLSKRHPDADRPLVDWDLILVMEPLTIGGALVGSFINKVCTHPARRNTFATHVIDLVLSFYLSFEMFGTSYVFVRCGECLISYTRYRVRVRGSRKIAKPRR